MAPPLDLYGIWAKRISENGETREHPLLFHLADVACVAEVLWDTILPEASRRWFSEGTGVTPGNARQWVIQLTGLHDLGKASRPFQEQLPDNARSSPHGYVTTQILEKRLQEAPFALAREESRRAAAVSGGHHGVLPSPIDIQQIGHGFREQPWLRLHTGLIDAFSTVFAPAEQPLSRIAHAEAMWLAGLVSVADWIGSNTDFFRFAEPKRRDTPAESLRSYVEDIARPAARRAMAQLGWSARALVTQPRDFSALFPAFSPNALQQAAGKLAEQLTQPGLLIIEAPMGEGKTEAALLLADHAINQQELRGQYVALPTMATSNQMFTRVNDFLAGRYDSAVQNQLLHGHAGLSAELGMLKGNFDSWLGFINGVSGISGDDASATVVAAEWFTARKRGLLSPFAVGTVDQTLLGVLQARHVFVRLFGLAHRVIVFDEVHAYDTYMSTLLDRLLEWLRALDCSVILLSATLPRRRREELLAAWTGNTSPPAATEPLYPRLSWAIGNEQGETTFAVSKRGEKQVTLRWTKAADGAAIARMVAGELVDGGCAAIVCSTVRRTQALYTAFRESELFAPGEVELFHARFPLKDRLAREARALARFGKPGSDGRTKARPARAVLIATQVIEQSLDVDFDLMITDLAPVDLILQRAGRLHRHPRADRPASLAAPTLFILEPERDGDGLPEFDSAIRHVYAENVLLRTWMALRERSSLDIPRQVAPLIAQVYDQETRDDVSEPLRRRLEKTAAELEAEQRSQEEQAIDRVLRSPDDDGRPWELMTEPRAEDRPEIPLALQALTRLTEPTVTVVCHYGDLSEAVLVGTNWPLDLKTNPAWHLRAIIEASVTLSHRGVFDALTKTPPPVAWKAHAMLRSLRPLQFSANNTATVGNWSIRLDPELGSCIERSAE